MADRNLRRQKQRKKHYGKVDRRGGGHALIVKNHKQAIVSLVQRTSGSILIRKAVCNTS